MAELDAIHVKITGDASGLESAVRGAKSSLSSLEQYKNSMQAAQNTLNKSRAVLNNTQRAYEANTKSVTANIEALTKQKTSLETSIATKNNEIKALEHANTVVNKGSIAYKDNVKAIEWTKTELSSLEQQHKRVTDSIRTQETVLAGSKKAYEDAQATVKLATKQYEDYEKGLKAVERAEQAQQLQETGKKWKDTSDTINSVTKPLQYTALALAAGGVAAGKFAIGFEDSFAAVKKTVDGTPEQLERIKQDIIDMTTVGINGHNPIPLTTNELTALASAGGQLGIATENIADFTETMAMMGTATNLYGEQGAAVLARFMNVTNTSQDHVSNLGSAIVELGNNFATTEAEIAQMALNMGATGDVVGISAQDVLAYSTALSSLGVEAQAGGSSVARIWMDIQSAVSSGGKDLQKFAKLSGKSSKEFSEQWKKDASGAFQDFLKGLNESDDQIGVLADLGFNNIRDIQALQRLAGGKGLELLTDAIKRSNDAWEENAALQNEFNSKAETTASQIQVVKNNAVEAARGFGEVILPTVKNVTSSMAEYARGLADMSDDSKRKLVSVAGGIVALGAVSKGVVVGTKAIGGFIEGVSKIPLAVSGIEAMTTASAGLSGTVTTLAGAMAPLAAPAAVVAGYALIAKYNTEAIENNARLGQSYKELYDKWGEAKDHARHIADLRDEYNLLSDAINSGSLEGEELTNSKNRTAEIIEEIKSIVSDEDIKLMIDTGDYKTALDAAVSDAQDAADKIRDELDIDNPKKAKKAVKGAYGSIGYAAQAENYRSSQQEMATWLQTATDYKSRYSQIINDINKASADGNKERRKAAENERQALIKEMQDSGFTEGYRKFTGGDFDFGDMEEFRGQIQNVRTAYKDMGTAAANSDELVKEGQKSLQAVANTVRDSSLELYGFKTAQDAIAAGDNAVANVCSEMVSSMEDLGFHSEDIAVQLSLFRNGLNSVSDAANAGALGTVTEQANELAHSLGLIAENEHIEISADGNLEIVDEAKEKIEDLPDEHNTEINATDNTADAVQSANDNLSKIPRVIPVTIDAKFNGSNFAKFGNTGVFREATGTQNFSGGLAMVNDQKGISDPRELIIDRGRAFIPEGRDVILPLSKGAKVYTAAQTKAIMSGAGIPHYATGKNNSDAFTAARDDWQHYTKTHAVTTAQELEKWVEFSEKFKSNSKDIADIQEQIFSLQRKINDETNKASLAYIDDRTALNDWEEYGDSAVLAFGRIRDRNKEALDAGRITWDEYSDKVKAAGKAIYDGMQKYSESWLSHAERYNGLTVDNYLAGIDRMRDRTKIAYDQGLIDKRKYTEDLIKYDEQYFDKYREKLDKSRADSIEYLQRRSYFNNWEEFGDDPFAAYDRAMKPLYEALEKYGATYWDEFVAGKKEIDDAFMDSYYSMEDRWSDEQRKYFGMTDEAYAESIERRINTAKKFYDYGIGSEQDLHERVTEMNHALWDEAESAYEEMLKRQSDYISEMRDKFSKEEQALRDSWTVEDRKADMATVSEQLRVYKGAVTERGQQKYKELQEQMKKLKRDEELYNLQVKNNAVIEQYEAEYKQLEADKKKMISDIAKVNKNISTIVGTFTDNLEGTANSMISLLQQILNTVETREFVGPIQDTTYSDNRKITINAPEAPKTLQEYFSWVGR